MYKIMAHNKLGFTLVELLVVIAIIGILSTVSIINLNTVKAKARDAVRLHELDENNEYIETHRGIGYSLIE